MNIVTALCEQFETSITIVENIIKLIDDDNTIPFIARYRKEMTGSMDDQKLRELCERLNYLRSLEQRREEVRALIDEQGNLTDEISAALNKAAILSEIEDIYRPFRPKRKTRASIAKQKGLEPLAMLFLEQSPDSPPPLSLAEQYINAEMGVNSAEEALAGASDIIAEMAADHASVRRRLRVMFTEHALIISKSAKKEDSVYADYYDFSEPVRKIAGHRILAIDRGEREGFLKVSVEFDSERAVSIVCSAFVKQGSLCTEIVSVACTDGYTRLIYPSIEREMRSILTEAAAEAAIRVFGQNLRPLLMQPPILGQVIMAIDPGFRTGCKVAVIDAQSAVLDTGVIYPVPPHNKFDEAERILTTFVKKHNVAAIAIGNGTAGRETEQFVVSLLPKWGNVGYCIVNEAGASVYSASKLGADEFPQFDVSLRSAVSIARRLQDPLAELVKIDPKSIGVGQYQHDLPAKQLEETLSGVVEDCVNAVGVDANTASASLLEKVSGISAALAKSVVNYREENGAFISRDQLKKVPKLGPKAFLQCAGFLRIRNGSNALDNTGVHPESYAAVKKLAKLQGINISDLAGGLDTASFVAAMGDEQCAEAIGVGVPTLTDIIAELKKPGRDPREDLPLPVLRTDVLEMSDLKAGMVLAGTVRNVIDFGAFVDIGVHQDGLVHISQICDKFIKHPSEALEVGKIVKVKVLDIDMKKKRISLTMKGI